MARTTLAPPYTITIKVDAQGQTTTTVTADGILPESQPDYLTENFSWTEVTYSETAVYEGIDNTPAEDCCEVIESCTGPFMEQVRSLLGNNRCTVSSWYRCDELNEAIGGSTTSEHRAGRAVDFICPDYGTPYQVCHTLMSNSDLQFNQLIYENHGGSKWIHISCAAPGEVARREVLTMDSAGTHYGLVG